MTGDSILCAWQQQQQLAAVRSVFGAQLHVLSSWHRNFEAVQADGPSLCTTWLTCSALVDDGAVCVCLPLRHVTDLGNQQPSRTRRRNSSSRLMSLSPFSSCLTASGGQSRWAGCLHQLWGNLGIQHMTACKDLGHTRVPAAVQHRGDIPQGHNQMHTVNFLPWMQMVVLSVLVLLPRNAPAGCHCLDC